MTDIEFKVKINEWDGRVDEGLPYTMETFKDGKRVSNGHFSSLWELTDDVFNTLIIFTDKVPPEE